MCEITILHLSDIHFKDSAGYAAIFIPVLLNS